MSASVAWSVPGSRTRFSIGDRDARVAHAMNDDDARLCNLDERALVDACLASTAGAFDLVVERHRRAVYQLCYRFVGNHEDASDLTQDVFLRAFRGLRTFRGQSSIATWLYRIGVNVCLNHVSARSLSAKAAPLDPLESQQIVDTRAETASERLLRSERGARVRAAIAQLPPKQRAALILRIYHELSHQEIAKVLKSSAGAVKANVFHALRSLKRLLDEDL
jgi:RNA polymerase sigma-70 factor (ECF subfamily)